MPTPLSDELLRRMDAYWRAANYLAVGQIYLLDNPLLREPLRIEHVKPRLLGHWGTTPGLNFLYVHLNRLIVERDLNMLFIAGPGHGGPAVVANTYLEGTYSEIYPNVSQDAEGMRRLFRQFSFPGGIPSHAAPETPGSIHEGGELGYALSHAYGAAFDNPDLLVACVVGDGEAETGPLATAWHSNKFLDPVTDGAVLPILHLNGYKIANPTVLARIPRRELESLLVGYGHAPYFVEGDEPATMHRLMAETLDAVLDDVAAIQRRARAGGVAERPRWPMIVLKTPKGWTGPKVVDGQKTEGSWRSHQVPLTELAVRPEHLKLLEDWMCGYRPSELFDADGRLVPELAELAPRGTRRMGANPHANGGLLLRDLDLPDFRDYAVEVSAPGTELSEATRVLGGFLRDVMQRSAASRTFRVMSPDELTSNRLGALLEVTDRAWMAERLPEDDHLAPDGRVMEILSEHTCQGWLEGYLLTGRHGLFATYEAFVHVVDSMFNQHAKWLESAKRIHWRAPIASLNYLLSSHVWRQDHNGFSHQDPGFIDYAVNKRAEVIRVYLPPDANTLLSVADHCLRSRDYVNVVVAGKQPAPQYLDMDAAIKHCTAGIGIWEWASNDRGREPDVVMACAGDVPTLETLAAVDLLRRHLPDLKIRVINVVDLMRLQPREEHPHGLSDRDFDGLFTADRPVIFAYHGYPWLIHRLTYRRTNHQNLHVRGYKEEGTTTTPFDMVVRNDLDRYHLAIDVIDRVPSLGPVAAYAKQAFRDKLVEHQAYIREHGDDLPEVRDWRWGQASNPGSPTGPRGPAAGELPGCPMAAEGGGPTRVLVLNSGSSSLKWSVLGARTEAIQAQGGASWEGAEGGRHEVELRAALQQLPRFDAVGHRVVHGGGTFRASVLIDERVRQAIADLAVLAPLHNPAALAGIDAVAHAFPDVPQVAAFDTAFHATIPDAAAYYPVPWDWTERWGLRRFGFHGLSVQYALRRCRELLGGVPRRLVVCHLGAGCSVTAVAEGRSVDTSMGFTPLEGLMMARRSGSIDPGLLLYLLRQHGIAAAELETALDERAGLLGVSGVSADLRAVLAALDAGDRRAELAWAMFVHRLVATVGAMVATLGGLDALVFTGGIGEHSGRARDAVVAAFGYLGLRLDPAANAAGEDAGDRDVAAADSTARVLVIAAREDLAILAEVTRLLGRGATPTAGTR